MSRSPMTDTDTVDAPVQAGAAAPRERRLVYSGQAGGGQNEYLTRGNKPLKRRRKSPFKIVTLIAAVSLLIVFYVWNKITVNRLMADLDELEAKELVLQGNIKRYIADIDRKSQLDRIQNLAMTKLGMIHNPNPQVYFEVEDYPASVTEPGQK